MLKRILLVLLLISPGVLHAQNQRPLPHKMAIVDSLPSVIGNGFFAILSTDSTARYRWNENWLSFGGEFQLRSGTPTTPDTLSWTTVQNPDAKISYRAGVGPGADTLSAFQWTVMDSIHQDSGFVVLGLINHANAGKSRIEFEEGTGGMTIEYNGFDNTMKFYGGDIIGSSQNFMEIVRGTGRILIGEDGGPLMSGDYNAAYTLDVYAQTTADDGIRVYDPEDAGGDVGDMARIIIEKGSAATGDPAVGWVLTGIRAWHGGIDHSDGDKWKLNHGNDIDSTSIITATTSGRVGIGEVLSANDPSAILDVHGAGTTLVELRAYENSATEPAEVQAEQDGDGDVYFQATLSGIRSWTFGINNSESDNWELNHGNDLDASPLLAATTGDRIGILSNLPQTVLDIRTDATSDDGLRVFENSGTESAVMIVEQDGTHDAEIQFTLTANRTWTIGVNNSQSDNWEINSNTGLDASPVFVVETGGNIGIGTNNPAELLEVRDGTILNYQNSATAARHVAEQDGTGDAYFEAKLTAVRS